MHQFHLLLSLKQLIVLFKDIMARWFGRRHSLIIVSLLRTLSSVHVICTIDPLVLPRGNFKNCEFVIWPDVVSIFCQLNGQRSMHVVTVTYRGKWLLIERELRRLLRNIWKQASSTFFIIKIEFHGLPISCRFSGFNILLATWFMSYRNLNFSTLSGDCTSQHLS